MDLLTNFDRLALPLRQILGLAADKAAERGWQLYLVGGGVRDLLLATGDEPVMLNDLDLVVDGARSATVGAGAVLAQELQAIYPAARLAVHGKFQTAALLWEHDPVLDSLWIDIATARTEVYPYPAANPVVESSSIQADLSRRDFTVNALALRLTPPLAGTLLDQFGGVGDLQQRMLRVLHPDSFIDDPTRIYRGVRFAVRFGFQFEAQTAAALRSAIASGIYQQVRVTGQPVPSLQTRLKSELKYIFQAPYWRAAIALLADFDALTCVHADLKMNLILFRQLRLMECWMQRFDCTLPRWQMLVEVLLAAIAPDQRQAVAQGLQLPADSLDRLARLAAVETIVGRQLPTDRRPSQVVQLLKPYDVPLLLLLGVRSGAQRSLIRRYLNHWSRIKPLLGGDDLKQLGYRPGKEFKLILAAILDATLDEVVTNRESAIAFLHDRFPL